jgi:GTP-binding protein HflX
MIEGKSARSERALLVGLIHREQPQEKMEEYLAELAFLVETAGATCVERAHQKLDRPHPAYFIGPGKLEEIRLRAGELNIDLVVFDDELSPSQLKNIEKEFNPKEFENNIKVMDRTNLILDIFAQRARTAHAKTQVELAQYQYLLPRLTRMWTHLERQKGGIGLRGPGETEIETDRRIIRDKISLLKTRLGTIDKQMQTQRKNRGELVRVALVGYTNVGKSTLMNLLSKSEVFAENKLFATLDTTVRKVVIENLPFLLSDTVGFIRKLPTQLVESFKSTLDEVRESDLLLHVVDVSHPQFEDHVQVVQRTLNEIGAGEKPTLMVFNKVDAYRAAEIDPHDLTKKVEGPQNLEDLQRMWLARGADEAIFISATQRLNLDEFRSTLYRRISQIHKERYPYNHFLY